MASEPSQTLQTTLDSSALPGPSESERTPPSRAHDQRQRRWKRGTIVFAALILLVAVIAAIPMTRKKVVVGPKMTYAVARGQMLVTVLEEGKLESSENIEIKNKVRGGNTVIWVVDSGTVVKKGQELLRMDTLFIEEQINERSKYAHWSRSAAEGSEGRVKRNKLAVAAFEQGQFKQEEMTLQKDLIIATSRFKSNESILSYQTELAKRGYVSDLRLEQLRMQLQRSRLDKELNETKLSVLREYKKKEELQKLKGRYASTIATHKANVERAYADASRRDRAVEEHKHCAIEAPRGGLVIHPNAARWKNAPDVTEGATVWKDQVLLLMPDLNKMQVKIGVHESFVERVKPGLIAQVIVTGRKLIGTVESVASVTSPAVWWNGNRVEYDTIIKLPKTSGLMPGMSAEVEILIANYDDVLKIPVAAVIEVTEGAFCWVKTTETTERRKLVLGDSNEVFSIVKEGLDIGEEVVLDPLSIEEARLLLESDKKEKEKAGSMSQNSGEKAKSRKKNRVNRPALPKPTSN